ncbi:MAG: leucine-rich repeat domain-containing protein [Chitinophagaceae bacterium]
MKRVILMLICCSMFQILYAQKEKKIFVFKVDNQGIAVLTGYNGEDNIIKIPTRYKGLPIMAISSYKGKNGEQQGVFEWLDFIDSVEIPSTVVVIGENTFYHCENIRHIKLPSSISIIEASAFEGCINLQKINLPISLEKISNNLFAYCTNIKEIILPQALTTIGNEAFLECKSLTKITIPKNVTRIGYGAFDNCSRLKELRVESTLPPAVTNSFLENTSLELRIKVPQAQVAIYQSSPGWHRYGTKIEGF